MTSSLMISKSDVYIVIAIAFARVMGEAYRWGGGYVFFVCGETYTRWIYVVYPQI